MSEAKMNKRDIIAQAILAGGATKESLMEIANVNSAGLASQFTYLRMGGKCPVPDKETGVFSFISAEEWEYQREEARNNPAKKSAPKSPLERRQAFEKRATKLAEEVAKREATFDKDESKENELRLAKVNIEVELCAIDLNKVLAEKTDDEWTELIEEQQEANGSDDA